MTKLKILYLDIETAPSLGWVWGKYEQDVIDFDREWYMLCFTAKWSDSNKYITYGLIDFPEYEKDPMDDKALMRKLWDLIDEADIVVGHNGDNFDIKKMNSRFIVNGMVPPSPYRTVDTKKVARKYFGFNSNKLDDLGKTLNLGKKLPTGGFTLWKKCMEGDKAAWKKMKSYNKQDVALLEKIYLRMRPWMKNHPNIGINVDKIACHACGSTNTQKRGYNYTKLTRFQRMCCIDCGAWSQTNAVKIP